MHPPKIHAHALAAEAAWQAGNTAAPEHKYAVYHATYNAVMAAVHRLTHRAINTPYAHHMQYCITTPTLNLAWHCVVWLHPSLVLTGLQFNRPTKEPKPCTTLCTTR